MKNKMFFLIIIVIISLIIIISCSNGNSQEKGTLNSISEQQSNTTNNQLQTAENLEKGKSLVEERCTSCHDNEKTYSGKYDKKGWEKIVKDMINKGAKLNKEENILVVNYLYYNYGQTLVGERCISCHDNEKTYSVKKDKKGWTTIVNNMINKGAKLNNTEKTIVIDHLVVYSQNN